MIFTGRIDKHAIVGDIIMHQYVVTLPLPGTVISLRLGFKDCAIVTHLKSYYFIYKIRILNVVQRSFKHISLFSNLT